MTDPAKQEVIRAVAIRKEIRACQDFGDTHGYLVGAFKEEQVPVWGSGVFTKGDLQSLKSGASASQLASSRRASMDGSFTGGLSNDATAPAATAAAGSRRVSGSGSCCADGNGSGSNMQTAGSLRELLERKRVHLAEMPSGRPPMARYGAGRSLERFGVGDYNRTRTVTRPDSGWSIKFDDEYVVKQGVVSIRVRRASEGSGSSGEFAVAGTLTGCPGEFSALVTASRRQSGAGDGSRQPWAVTSSGGGARMSWSSGAAPPVCQRC